MKLPAPRGPLGASLTDLLVHPPRRTGTVDDAVARRAGAPPPGPPTR